MRACIVSTVSPPVRSGVGARLIPNAAGVTGKESQMSVHASPCNCFDDAQRHWALVARDLMAQGRESELTDDMRQAYELEFCTTSAPELDPF